jgi:hypothetical protein
MKTLFVEIINFNNSDYTYLSATNRHFHAIKDYIEFVRNWNELATNQYINNDIFNLIEILKNEINNKTNLFVQLNLIYSPENIKYIDWDELNGKING